MKQHIAPISKIADIGSPIAEIHTTASMLAGISREDSRGQQRDAGVAREQLRQPEADDHSDQFEHDFFEMPRRRMISKHHVVQPEPRGLERTIVCALRKMGRVAKPPAVVEE